jgi:hypothetical protein
MAASRDAASKTAGSEKAASKTGLIAKCSFGLAKSFVEDEAGARCGGRERDGSRKINLGEAG